MSLPFTLDQVDGIGAALARILKPGDAIGLKGDLGAGKTTLARAILSGLGLQGEAPSPSFAIVQPYAPPELHLPLLHIDLYRIEDPEELDELGLDEARDDHVLLVEWPERMGRRQWSDMLMLSIDFDGPDARRLTASVPPAWKARLAVPAMIPPPATPDFLAAAGWSGAVVSPLAGDASFRRYFRVQDGDRHAVLMDAPPPHEDPRPFIAVAEYLTGIGLAAPRILHRDLDQGLLLIEDFGADRMREAVDADLSIELPTYAGLIDVLVALHRHAPAPGLAAHDLDVWLDEVMLLTDWYGPAVGLDLPRDSFREAWRAVLEPVEQDGLDRVTILRDFHAENIMLIAGGEGVARYGLLDFQDALVGHPAYDLASVLEDARRDVSSAVERALIDAYIAATGRDERFERAYWALAAQRNTRILGVFCRLWKRDGKAHYTSFQPRMWGLLERDLAHPHLAPVKAWFDTHIPTDKRAAIWATLP